MNRFVRLNSLKSFVRRGGMGMGRVNSSNYHPINSSPLSSHSASLLKLNYYHTSTFPKQVFPTPIQFNENKSENGNTQQNKKEEYFTPPENDEQNVFTKAANLAQFTVVTGLILLTLYTFVNIGSVTMHLNNERLKTKKKEEEEKAKYLQWLMERESLTEFQREYLVTALGKEKYYEHPVIKREMQQQQEQQQEQQQQQEQ